VQVFGRARPMGRALQSVDILHNNRVVDSVAASGYVLATVRGSTSGKWQLRWTNAGVTYASRVAKALADPPPSAR
jgi:hypothetical protein